MGRDHPHQRLKLQNKIVRRQTSSSSRVLQVVHGFPPEGFGGTESYVLEATQALRAAGWDARVLSGSMEPRSPASVVDTDFEGIPVARLHREGTFLDDWDKSYDPAAASLFGMILEEWRPSLVHVHHWIRLTRNLVEVAASQGIPAVVTLHDAMASCPRVFRVREEALCHRPLGVESCLHCVPRAEWVKDADCAEEIEAYRRDFARELDLAAAIIVPSAAHRDFLSRELARPAEAFRVLPHGSLERDRPRRFATSRKAGVIRLGYWGHLAVYKGYHLLLEALRLLGDDAKRFHVVCFGTASDPEYRRRLDELSRGLAVKEIGAFTPADLGREPFDLAVIPSLASESFSFVLDEAFELGVPALVPDRGALAERIGEAGATFAPESAESLAERLREILADPAVLDRWSASIPGLRPMAEHAAKLIGLYGEVLTARPRAVPLDAIEEAARLGRLARRVEARTRALAEARDLAIDRARQLELKERDLAEFNRSIEDHVREREEAKRVLAEFEKSVADHARTLAEREEELRLLQKASAEARDLATDRARQLERKERDLAEFSRSIAEHVRDREKSKGVLAGFEKSVAEHARRLGEREEEVRLLQKASAEAREALASRDAMVADLERSVAVHQAEIARQASVLEEFEKSTADLREQVEKLDEEKRAQLELRADAESAWKRRLGEHQESIDLHEEVLAARARETAALRSRVDEAVAHAKSLALELLAVQAGAQAEAAARARMEQEARLLDAACAEDRREIESWRTRATRTEAVLFRLEAERQGATARLADLEGKLGDVARGLRLLEDDSRRIADLQDKAATSLALSLPDDTDRVARAAALTGAVIAQQGNLESLRTWLRDSNGASTGREVLRRLEELPRRLRVLMVIHDFLPYHAAGSEMYTWQLAKALQARCDVELLFTENRPDRPQFEIRRGEWDGIPFTEVVHHAAFPDFGSTYEDARMEARFDEVVERFSPDVVHVQHSKFFGVGIFRSAARRNLPVVHTLHEYFPLCARDGQLLKADLERCDLPEPGKCGECMASSLRQAAPWARAAGAFARLLPRKLGTRLERLAARSGSVAATPSERRAMLADRERAVRDALSRCDLFLAPSEFLRRTFVASGFVPEDRIVVSRYGQDLSRFRDAPRPASQALRVGYLGTVAAYKGVEVLVDALNRLAGHPVEGRIHGVTEFFPDFVERIEAKITNPRVRLLGRYDNREVGRILSEIDVLVVPSLWWENSPITIHEAFLAGVPVVASDQGGMAELVQDGKNGFLFKIGDAADLARVLLRFVADPALVGKLRPRRETIRDIREDAVWTEAQYRRLIAARKR